jgi:hypothetical protein
MRSPGGHRRLALAAKHASGGIAAASFDARTVVAGGQSGATLYRDEVPSASLPVPGDDCVGSSTLFNVAPGGSVASLTHDCSRPWMSNVGPCLQIFDAATGAALQTIHKNVILAPFAWDGSQFADGDTLWCR